MKTIALFGGTGKTGQIVLQNALKAGFKVKALVRDANKVTIKSNDLTVIEGDILDAAAVDNTVVGCDIVLSLFGHVKNSPEWLQTNGTKNIIQSMDKFQVDRIISLSGGGLPFPSHDRPKFADKMIRTIMKIAVPKILNDAISHAEILKSSNKKWMIVRGPRLTNDPKAGNYRVGWVGVNASTKISRGDLADFIISQIDDERFNFQMPFVSN